MTVELIRDLFAWCSLINLGLLIWWVLFLMFAHDWVYRMHCKWFNLSVEKFDSIHYTAITFFKIFIFAFNLAPYFALRILA